MRLWSVHPRYLDAKGLVALWREGLLAQKVLLGHTKGYQHHPQLIRFQEHSYPLKAIAQYLHHVCDEALDRGYSFNREKILSKKKNALALIKVGRGQVAYEFEHLKKKLFKRDRLRYQRVYALKIISIHPSFKRVPGAIADWEKIA